MQTEPAPLSSYGLIMTDLREENDSNGEYKYVTNDGVTRYQRCKQQLTSIVV